jgi:hypothetical protein
MKSSGQQKIMDGTKKQEEKIGDEIEKLKEKLKEMDK